MKKNNKFVMLILAMVMTISSFLPNLSYASDMSLGSKELRQDTQVIDVTDENGITWGVEITENIYYSNIKNNSKFLMNYSSAPKVGDKRTYTVKISNEAMWLPSGVASTISLASGTKAVKIATDAIAKKLGSKFLPGINVVSTILGTGALINGLTGKSGITLTIDLEYKKVYSYYTGNYEKGWYPVNLSVGRY